VDVTIDGGENWYEARLAQPGTKMALTRFYLDIEWDGEEMFLQSRAMMKQAMFSLPKKSLEKRVG
jgi:sulfane dehydrogenase subunit SoxC